MVPAGYLLKRIVAPPPWLDEGAAGIAEVCSVANCVNDDIVDVQGAWRQNGFGLANDPDVLAALAAEAGIDPRAGTLFYYTAHERELESDGWTFDPAQWRPRRAVGAAMVPDDVRVPPAGTTMLLGYDVVVFGDFLEHSPLSCNSVAATLPVNRHCLFASCAEAIAAIDAGAFGGGCEDGAYTVFGVHRVDAAGRR